MRLLPMLGFLLLTPGCRQDPKPVDTGAPVDTGETDTTDTDTTDTDTTDTDTTDTDTDTDTTPPEDVDGDAFSVAQGDCDDADASVHPGADERCDGVDQDCDGSIDEGALGTFYADADGDGYGDPLTATEACEGAAESATDCDDTRADRNPAAVEACDGVDNDCDDAIDEEGLSTWYTDADGDGHGDPATAALDCEAAGRVSDDTDCDDTDAAISPLAAEVCDHADNDCDGSTDESVTSVWYIDYDGDGYGSDAYLAYGCSAPAGYVATDDDCSDIDAEVSPSATEVCNSTDDDCDGDIDEPDAADALTWYPDADGDGYGTSGPVQLACALPAGYAATLDDCDDRDANVHPDATEVCSVLIDQDCDGITPEMCTSCLSHLLEAGAASDGLYTVDLDGTAGALPSQDVWCDMTTDGGGWTLVQRTLWDWSATSLLDTGYADWFGSTLGLADAGEVYRLAGEAWPTLDVEQEMMAVHVARDAASGADCDPLYYEGGNVTFTISSTDATVSSVTSSVSLTNSTELSTADSGAGSDCINSYDAVPWFYSYCCTTCPSFFGGYWTDQAHPMASYIDTTGDLYGRTGADVCPSGAAVTTSSYEGVNVMEVYLR